jgi:hypothetical protein
LEWAHWVLSNCNEFEKEKEKEKNVFSVLTGGGYPRYEKISCAQVLNKLVKTSQGSLPILRIIKLSSVFLGGAKTVI